MNGYALNVKGLSKKYDDFILDHITFDVPKGAIVGLIGENGAGKSTTIQAILGLIQKDEGAVLIDGKAAEEIDDIGKEALGVVFDGSNFPESLTIKKLNHVLRNIYPSWDEEKFYTLLTQMAIPVNKKIKELSKGMKMKLSIVTALSHHAKFLVLDEATSGLDPVVRDDILDLFLEFVQDEACSILVSSHITTDLEKVADYIVFIHQGKIVFSKPKDELIYEYGIIKCGAAQFEEIAKEDILVYRKQDYQWQVLVANKAIAQKKYPKAIIDPATIDDIMLLYVKGEK
ncbi:MAG: ABC transporter ATP-binding protein [Cellulosilyticaceae bacterium]